MRLRWMDDVNGIARASSPVTLQDMVREDFYGSHLQLVCEGEPSESGSFAGLVLSFRGRFLVARRDNPNCRDGQVRIVKRRFQSRASYGSAKEAVRRIYGHIIQTVDAQSVGALFTLSAELLFLLEELFILGYTLAEVRRALRRVCSRWPVVEVDEDRLLEVAQRCGAATCDSHPRNPSVGVRKIVTRLHRFSWGLMLWCAPAEVVNLLKMWMFLNVVCSNLIRDKSGLSLFGEWWAKMVGFSTRTDVKAFGTLIILHGSLIGDPESRACHSESLWHTFWASRSAFAIWTSVLEAGHKTRIGQVLPRELNHNLLEYYLSEFREIHYNTILVSEVCTCPYCVCFQRMQCGLSCPCVLQPDVAFQVRLKFFQNGLLCNGSCNGHCHDGRPQW